MLMLAICPENLLIPQFELKYFISFLSQEHREHTYSALGLDFKGQASKQML